MKPSTFWRFIFRIFFPNDVVFFLHLVWCTWGGGLLHNLKSSQLFEPECFFCFAIFWWVHRDLCFFSTEGHCGQLFCSRRSEKEVLFLIFWGTVLCSDYNSEWCFRCQNPFSQKTSDCWEEKKHTNLSSQALPRRVGSFPDCIWQSPRSQLAEAGSHLKASSSARAPQQTNIARNIRYVQYRYNIYRHCGCPITIYIYIYKLVYWHVMY